jgi:type II secretory pathway pseudopilin PulG
MLKKAAMFGLDARIALAIFGALSVISGAALYSAIQGSKITALITEANELGKAYTAYYLDTGTALPVSSGDWLKLSSLITDDGVSGWNGPYFNATFLADHAIDTPLVGRYLLAHFLDGEWTATTADQYCGTGTVGGACSLWIGIYGGDVTNEVVRALDEAVDGGSYDVNNGNLRLRVSGSSTNYIYYKYSPELK